MNVLLITIDSLRGDMPWNGYEHAIAPELTKLAARSVVYTDAHALSSYTAKSVSGLLASRYPSEIRRSAGFYTRFSPHATFFPELLQRAGVRTLAVHANMYFHQRGLEQGFDVWEIVEKAMWKPKTARYHTGREHTDRAIEVLADADNHEEPFFAWFHYMDPHAPYVSHREAPDFGRGDRAKYDAEVWYADHHVGRLLRFVESQPWSQRTAIIVSADHGESFGENGHVKHAFELWDQLTRVPVLVRAPGAAARRIDVPRSHIDLAPTILQLLGVPVPERFRGTSLVAEIYGGEAPVRDVLCELPEDTQQSRRRALISDGFKLVVRGKDAEFHLFERGSDPGDQRNLAAQRPDVLKRMRARYERRWSGLDFVLPYGGNPLADGSHAFGPK